MKEVTIVHFDKPISENHMYGRHGNHTYLKKEGRLYEKNLKELAQEAWKAPATQEPCHVKIVYYFGDRRRRDVSNYNKAPLDALSEIVYRDDSQITRLVLEKKYDKENPRTEIFIKEIPND